jgi:hypothetical protein
MNGVTNCAEKFEMTNELDMGDTAILQRNIQRL